MELSSSRPSVRPLTIGSAIVAAAVGAWILYTFPPGAGSFYPPCVFRRVTGLLCPGCGSTRALHQLLHGHIEAAIRLNPFLFVVMLGGVYATPSFLQGRIPPLFMKTWFAWACFAVVMTWWILRNVL